MVRSPASGGRRPCGATAIRVPTCMTDGQRAWRDGRPARRAGQGIGASVLRSDLAGAGASRGVPEIAGRAVGGGRSGGCAGSGDGIGRRFNGVACARDAGPAPARVGGGAPMCSNSARRRAEASPGSGETGEGSDPAGAIPRTAGQNCRRHRVLQGDRQGCQRNRGRQAGGREDLCPCQEQGDSASGELAKGLIVGAGNLRVMGRSNGDIAPGAKS